MRKDCDVKADMVKVAGLNEMTAQKVWASSDTTPIRLEHCMKTVTCQLRWRKSVRMVNGHHTKSRTTIQYSILVQGLAQRDS